MRLGQVWSGKGSQPANLGGGGHTFAFIRSTRGGTSGTSTTGANRVDDSQFTFEPPKDAKSIPWKETTTASARKAP